MKQIWFITGSLPLGVNAIAGTIRLDEHLLAEDHRWSDVSRSADFSEPYPVGLPADETTEMSRSRICWSGGDSHP